MTKITVGATLLIAGLVLVEGKADATPRFMATSATCSQAPADQQSECRACVDTQAMLRTGVAKHWWPSQPAGDRCVLATRTAELIRGGGSSSSPSASPSPADGGGSSPSAAGADRPNESVYTSSRCDRLFRGAQRDECRACTSDPRGRYHQYEAAGSRCRDRHDAVIAVGGGAAAPAAPAPAAGNDPRNDPREYSTVYTTSRCDRHVAAGQRAECTRCVDTPRGAPVRRYHQFEAAGTRCRTGRNEIVQP